MTNVICEFVRILFSYQEYAQYTECYQIFAKLHNKNPARFLPKRSLSTTKLCVGRNQKCIILSDIDLLSTCEL